MPVETALLPYNVSNVAVEFERRIRGSRMRVEQPDMINSRGRVRIASCEDAVTSDQSMHGTMGIALQAHETWLPSTGHAEP